jgi:dGTPase
MIDYAKILSSSRLRASKRSERTILTESESDRGRILFCAAFRRLQQKAQVFSMEPNAAVRSRLTHSFEVSQLGRYIADEVGQRLLKSHQLDALQQGALVNFVETACLMHDIGNPPFGHFGEAAIQEWFRKNGEEALRAAVEVRAGSDDNVRHALSDFVEFDGNPQGLRVVARLQWNTDEFGLNLTKTALASFLKYVRCAGEEDIGRFTKKAGYFTTESKLVQQVWQTFGYAAPQRFPLTYMMEAADDIAFCISDLEDSFEKEVIQPATALPDIEQRYQALGFKPGDACHKEIVEALAAVRAKEKDGEEFTYTDFRTSLNTAIVRYVADRYVEEQEKIARGELDALLPENEPPGAVLKVLKEFCREHVYTHESLQRVELAGYAAISGLLDTFLPLLSASRERFGAALRGAREDARGVRVLIEPKLLKLFPEKYKKVYEHQNTNTGNDLAALFLEWNTRAHLVVDYISGMTDDFAMTTYRTLAGMRI